MKRVLLVLALAGALLAVLALGLLWATDGVRARGDDVIAALRDGNSRYLRELMAPRMIAVISPEELLRATGVWGLAGATDLRWSGRSVSTDGGEISGHFDQDDQQDIAFTLAFDRIDGEYLLRLVEVDNPWRISDPQRLAIPSEPELVALVNGVTRDFGRATSSGNMAALHEIGSRDFRASVPVALLERSFAGFIQAGIDTGQATVLAWQATEAPRIDDEGVLRIAGRYATTPMEVQFAYGFAFEQGRWKLYALNVQLVDPGAR